jgi:uncharacterized protein
MKFDILCTRPIVVDDKIVNDEIVRYVYDNQTSEIFDNDGNLVDVRPVFKHNYDNHREFPKTSAETPTGKRDIRRLRIQLGLACNYSCEYCNQRFIPHADESNLKYTDKFLSNLDLWIKTPPEEIEFWGGEPLVYIKTLKPLANEIRKKYPDAKFTMITNGSLLNDEIIDWLEELDFSIGISHDGPGQNVRGPDPLEDPEQKEMIMKLFSRLSVKGKISFNSMIHRENMDRAKIQEFFVNLLGKDAKFSIGEGSFIDPYDEGGLGNTLRNREEHLALRRITLDSLKTGTSDRFTIVRERLADWLSSFGNRRPARFVGQKCNMDSEHDIAVDLRGNVLTCQNVTTAATAPNGNQHVIGHVSKLDQVKLNTATHWSFRDKCNNCPLVQVCKGSCMFLQGEMFDIACDNAYSDHLPFFALAFEIATGAMPFGILGIGYDLPDDRVDVWGTIDEPHTVPETRKVARELNA